MPSDTQELASLVKIAQDATKELETGHLRDIAFDKILTHLLDAEASSQAVAMESPVSMSSAGRGDRQVSELQPADRVLGDAQQRIDAVAHYFKVSPDDVSDIFELTDAEPSLVIRTAQLSPHKAKATQEIVLLIVGARTALGADTSTEHIRDVAEQYSKLDSPNFMRALSRMDGIAILGKRNSTNRLIRMKVRGAEEAQELAQQILSS